MLQKILGEYLSLISKNPISFNARLITLMSVVVIASTGCKKEEPPRSYKIIDTGMWTSVPGDPIKWLDNERVLFPSNEKLTPGGGPARMTVWKPATGQVEFFQPWSGDLCVEDAQVVYGVNDATGKKTTYYRGPVENPQEYPPPRPDMYMRRNYGCGWTDKDSRVGLSAGPYLIKMKDENYLDIINSSNDLNGGDRIAVYYERTGAKAVQLPFHLDGKGYYRPEYIEWRNAYFISPNHYHPNQPLHLWWLQRDGRILEEPLPTSLPFPMEGGIDFFPTPNGIFIHYSGGDPRKDSGGYLLKDGNIDRIFSDSGRGVELSPDGCRVVFDHADNFKAYFSKVKPYRTLKIIDFCSQGEKQ